MLGLLPSDETFCSQAELNNCGGIDLAIWDSFGAKKDNLDAHFPFFADGVTFKVSGWDSLHNWSSSASIKSD